VCQFWTIARASKELIEESLRQDRRGYSSLSFKNIKKVRLGTGAEYTGADGENRTLTESPHRERRG